MTEWKTVIGHIGSEQSLLEHYTEKGWQLRHVILHTWPTASTPGKHTFIFSRDNEPAKTFQELNT